MLNSVKHLLKLFPGFIFETKSSKILMIVMKKDFFLIVIAFISGIGGAFTYDYLQPGNEVVFPESQYITQTADPGYVSFKEPDKSPAMENVGESLGSGAIRPDLVEASEKSTSSVVFIKTISGPEYGRGSWLDWFFEGGGSQTSGSGSGVLYSADGYIVTNNHVVDGADVIEVIHGKRTYPAEVVGTDPSSDLAVLKIEEKRLPAIQLGSSRDLAVGEWVLAVGNPFNLTSTVTAGIVSAKGRDINILKGRFPLESFIQTDAAINPGNSGGALVNSRGELVGINTAILSRTGSYAGYGFAVPVDIVKKVVSDLITYGETQKAFFGAEVLDLTPEIAEAVGVTDLNGVVLSYIQRDGAADKEGLEKGDIILEIDQNPVNSKSQFDEQISYYSPGNKINILFKRDKEIKNKTLTLTNREGTTSLIKREIYASKALGVDFEAVSLAERDQLGIDHGIRVLKVKDGFFRRLGIREGFIITSINRKPMKSPEQLAETLENIEGRIRIEGINERGVRGYYSYYF